jgi:hypothetical protein
VGTLVNFYERLLAKTNDQAEAADREQAQRVERAHELAADIDQFAGKIQKSLRSITTEETTVTVNDGSGGEITIEVIEPDPAKPATCFRVASSSGTLAEYDEDGLYRFLIEWVTTRPTGS